MLIGNGGKMMLNSLNKEQLYYFASPYSSENSFVRQIRYEATIYAASELTKIGFRLLEPIAMCHEQSNRHQMPSGYQFWQSRDRGFIDICDAVIVLQLEGWKESEGVSDEIQYAKSLGKEVHLLHVDDIIDQEVWNAVYRQR